MNPRLVEDQREAQQRLSKKALLASNPTQVRVGLLWFSLYFVVICSLQDEFVPGNSPFSTKDVTSKSAMLGLQGQV